MTVLGTTSPYYGGGQVPNPANVIQTSGAPSSNLKVKIGTIAVSSTGIAYIATLLTGGSTTWSVFAGSTAAVDQLTGDSGTATPSANSIKIAGTANQITTTGASHAVTLSLPSAITAPGSITATTSIASTTTMTAGTGLTATTGNITASSGNLSASGTVTGGTGVTATTGAVTATAGQLIAGGDTGGVASTVAISNTNSSTISTGVGSVKMSSANPATNTAWLKIYIGTSAFWIPAWTTNSP